MSAIIDEIVALIRGARYGRDVRESIAHGIEVIDDVAEGARDSATASATAAQNYAHNADQSASNAQTSETNASASAMTASQKATLSESWAVGGTGTRTDEDTNNAKYWSEQAQGAIDELSSNFSVESTTANGLRYWKFGRVVMVCFDANNITATANTPFAYIPSGYLPIYEFSVRETFNNKSLFFSGTDGGISCGEALSNVNIRGSFTYICQ